MLVVYAAHALSCKMTAGDKVHLWEKDNSMRTGYYIINAMLHSVGWGEGPCKPSSAFLGRGGL